MSDDKNGLIDPIEDFLKGNTDDVDANKTAKVILLAMRLDRKERRGEFRSLENGIKATATAVFGSKKDHTTGLAHRIGVLERFRKIVLWVLAIPTAAILTGLGAWLWSLVIQK